MTLTGLLPGDVIWTRGGGLVGWVIRHGTASPYGHVGIVHEVLETRPDGTQLLLTAEAWPSRQRDEDGVQWRTRDTATDAPAIAWRPARDWDELGALLLASQAHIGRAYGWGEIARIGLRMAGIKVRGWENADRVICSNHTTAAVLAARPDLAEHIAPLRPSEVWPGRLAEAAWGMEWLATASK